MNGKRWINRQWVDEAPPPEIDDPLFPVALDKYLEWYGTNRKQNSHTLHTYNSKPLRKFFCEYRLSQISPFLLEKYKIERKQVCECAGGPKRKTPNSRRCQTCDRPAKPLANATVNHELIILQHLFSRRVEWKLSTVNPMETVEFFKVDNGRNRYLTMSEAERLLAACTADFRPIVLTAMHTGFWKSELRTLRWSSVDMRHRTITVESCYAKNGDTRTVPMTAEVFATLKRLWEDRPDRKLEDVVFVNRFGKPYKSWRTTFQTAVKNAGLKDFHFHDLRHCFGSYLGMNSTNPKAMMELMGHRDPKMTMRYTHLSMDYKRQAVEGLPKFDAAVLEAESPRIPPHADEAKVVRFGKSFGM